jgi:hypothetical protein
MSQQQAIAASVPERIANATQYVGGTVAAASGLDWNMVGVIAGILIGLAGFLVNWHYQHKRFKLLQARMAQPNPPTSVDTEPGAL